VKNTLLHITDSAKLERIAYAERGQTAVTNLFRELTGQLVNRHRPDRRTAGRQRQTRPGRAQPPAP
jgi:hypothetical protein